METKSKILLLVYSLGRGGLERVVSRLSLNLPKNINHTIVLFEKKVSYSYKGKLISLNIIPSKNFFDRIYNFFKRIYKLRKVIKVEKPDVIISFDRGPNFSNVLSFNTPILTVHTRPSDDLCSYNRFNKFIHKLLIRVLYNKSPQVIAVSTGVKNDLTKNFGIKEEKIKVIYNSINIAKIKKSTLEKIDHPWFNENTPIIITSGRLTKQKGQGHLIRVFLEVRKQTPCRLVILGEGELRDYLEKLTRDLSLDGDTLFLGWQKNPFKYLLKATVFVFPSQREGFGNAIIEAMACKLPIISSDCQSGPREILAPDTDINYQTDTIEYARYGILTPVCDKKFYRAEDPLTKQEKVLAEAIGKMLKNKDLRNRYKKKSFKRARDFDVHKIINNYVEIINEHNK